MESDFLLRWQLPVSIGVLLVAVLPLLLSQETPIQAPVMPAAVITTPPAAMPAVLPVVEAPAAPPAAVELAAEPEPVAEPMVGQQEIEAFLDSWTTAWQQKQLDVYFLAYAATFVPANGKTRSLWQEERTRNIARARDIRISWHDPSWTSGPEAAATVEIWLDYQAAGYGDSTRKRMLLQREDGGLRIVDEQNLEIERH